jgi:hypothetical protein
MTKEQAIEKVNKLLALATNPAVNPNEKTSAEKQAKKLMLDYHLTADDLRSSSKVAAFDEIVNMVQEYAKKHPGLHDLESGIFGAAPLVDDVLGKTKLNLTPRSKAAAIDKIASGLRLARLLFGDSNQTVNDLRAIVESTFKSHGLPTT